MTSDEVLDNILLYQYQHKPITRSYIKCFLDEAVAVYNEAGVVLQDRLFDNANGNSLDVIGRILGVKRSLLSAKPYFSFDGFPNGLPFGDKDNPGTGGLFRDLNLTQYETLTMTDTAYRNVIRARAYMMHRDGEASADDVYTAVALMIGRYPQYMRLQVTGGALQMHLRAGEVLADEVFLLTQHRHWLVSAGSSIQFIQE